MKYTTSHSPLGPLLLCWEEGLSGLYFPHHAHGRRPTSDDEPTDAPFAATIRQLAEYFAGSRRAFDLPLAPHGTPFQVSVWRELARIPYGATTSYGAIAAAIGAPPGAARAVGAAVGRNPISIVVPCHRVLGAGGAITGYAGGLPAKTFLLDLERAAIAGETGAGIARPGAPA